MRTLLPLIAGLAAAGPLRAEPVVVDLADRGTARAAVVLVSDVARLSGGDPVVRDRVAALDLADLPARGPAVTVTRKSVEYRFRLAGLGPSEVQVVGAERATVTQTRRRVTSEEVVAAVRAELLRLFPTPDGLTADLVRPVAVQLPEVPVGERLAIHARPHSKDVAPGRVQMDVTLSAAGERLLSFALLFEVKQSAVPLTLPPTVIGAAAGGPVAPAAATSVPTGEVLVRPRQRVQILVRSGSLRVTAVGEAVQEGRLGQQIPVQNVDSKKVLTARVTGPGAVEVELGGVP